MNKLTGAAELHSLATTVGRAMEVGDWLTALSFVAPNVVAHVPQVGDFSGQVELAGFLAETSEKTVDGERFELLDVLAGQHYVALYFRITAERVDRDPLDNATVHLARVNEQGLLEEIWFHNFDGLAVAEFWS